MRKKKDGLNEKRNICTSIFKGGGSTTTKEIYTQKWGELINAMERRKK